MQDPACQKIDTLHQCYVMDPFCQDQMSGEDTVNPILVNLTWSLVAAVLIVVVLISLCAFMKSRKSAKGAYNEYKSLSYLLTNEVI